MWTVWSVHIVLNLNTNPCKHLPCQKGQNAAIGTKIRRDWPLTAQESESHGAEGVCGFYFSICTYMRAHSALSLSHSCTHTQHLILLLLVCMLLYGRTLTCKWPCNRGAVTPFTFITRAPHSTYTLGTSGLSEMLPTHHRIGIWRREERRISNSLRVIAPGISFNARPLEWRLTL